MAELMAGVNPGMGDKRSQRLSFWFSPVGVRQCCALFFLSCIFHPSRRWSTAAAGMLFPTLGCFFIRSTACFVVFCLQETGTATPCCCLFGRQNDDDQTG